MASTSTKIHGDIEMHPMQLGAPRHAIHTTTVEDGGQSLVHELHKYSKFGIKLLFMAKNNKEKRNSSKPKRLPPPPKLMAISKCIRCNLVLHGMQYTQPPWKTVDRVLCTSCISIPNLESNYCLWQRTIRKNAIAPSQNGFHLHQNSWRYQNASDATWCYTTCNKHNHHGRRWT